MLALVVLLLGLLPIVNWVPGGRQAGWYGAVASQWLTGSMVVLGVALLGAILGRQVRLSTAPWGRLAERAVQAPAVTGVLLGSAGSLLFAVVAWRVFSATPLHLDEVAQVVQARILAQGRLWLDAPTAPEFRSLLHILDIDGKWFAQFPPGGPLMLVPGVWVGAPWLVGPVLGGASVAAFWGIARRVLPAPAALGSALLFLVTPFVVTMSASHMNHVAALWWLLVASLSVVRIERGEGRWSPLVLGLALGMLAATRPVDAVAYAVPAGAWMAWRGRAGGAGLRAMLLSGVGVALPVAALLAWNAATTGSATLFAYEKLWGAEHGLGFHQPPWGEAHTPATGLELVSLYFLRLQTYLFETPVPSLVFVAAGLAVARLRSAVERIWVAGGVLLVLLYFMYWHDGFYLGPRFVYLLTPLFVLVSGGLMTALGAQVRSAALRRGAWSAVGASAAMAVAMNIPERWAQYGAGLSIMRQDPVAVAERAGVRESLILVRESWGAQLVARLWALGVSRSETEGLYRRVDACALDEAISGLERGGVRGAAATDALRPLMRDSLSLVASPWSPDGSERALPGRTYGAGCQARILEDRAGFTVMGSVLARDWGSNVFARDLHARDTLLLQEHGSRPLYLLRTAGPESNAPLELVPLSRDSLQSAWRE